MTMTTTLTLRYEGAPSCVDCQRTGIPVCAHVGFNPDSWEVLIGQAVYAPGLNDTYTHTLTRYEISDDRKTATLTIATERPRFHDLARHLSLRIDTRAKANVRAVHHDTGDTLEEGYYDRFLCPGEQVCIDRDLYHVTSIEHPNHNPDTGIADGPDLQVARLIPVPTEQVRPIAPIGEARD